MRFWKYQALGNDYLVARAENVPTSSCESLSPALIRRICDRHFGLGSDGLLLIDDGPLLRLRIFNPDGGEAEKSGNGLRIAALWLHQQGRVAAAESFTVSTLGGEVNCRVEAGGENIRVEMGTASFWSDEIPMLGERREVVRELLTIAAPGVGHEVAAGGKPAREALVITALTIGNPHCVVFDEQADERTARRLGPRIETHPAFPRRTNVQFVRVRSRLELEVFVWERGAGYTLASGSSSCAAFAAARRLGLCDAQAVVHLPGGKLRLEELPSGVLVQSGGAELVAEGRLDAAFLERHRADV